jgi:hypothetical protein
VRAALDELAENFDEIAVPQPEPFLAAAKAALIQR